MIRARSSGVRASIRSISLDTSSPLFFLTLGCLFAQAVILHCAEQNS